MSSSRQRMIFLVLNLRDEILSFLDPSSSMYVLIGFCRLFGLVVACAFIIYWIARQYIYIFNQDGSSMSVKQITVCTRMSSNASKDVKF